MAAITDLSDFINRASGGNSGTPETIHFFKGDRIASTLQSVPTAGRWVSLNMADGMPCGTGGATVTTSTVPTNASNGTLRQTDPGGGRTKWLTGLSVVSSVAGTLMLYDRLVEAGGWGATTTTAQTTNLPTSSLTRNTGGVGNQIWLEVHSTVGNTVTSITVDYKNQAGTQHTSPAITFGGTGIREIGRLLPVPLLAGDTGVTTIENVDLVASTGTAGSFGAFIARPLLVLPLNIAGVGDTRNLLTGFGPIEIPTDCALSMAFLESSTTPAALWGSAAFVEA